MRIAGYIEHPTLKITVFIMNNRYSVKFENGVYEQTFKIRQGSGVDSLQDIRDLVNEPFLKTVEANFKVMHETMLEGLSRFQPEEDEFEEII